MLYDDGSCGYVAKDAVFVLCKAHGSARELWSPLSSRYRRDVPAFIARAAALVSCSPGRYEWSLFSATRVHSSSPGDGETAHSCAAPELDPIQSAKATAEATRSLGACLRTLPVAQRSLVLPLSHSEYPSASLRYGVGVLSGTDRKVWAALQEATGGGWVPFLALAQRIDSETTVRKRRCRSMQYEYEDWIQGYDSYFENGYSSSDSVEISEEKGAVEIKEAFTADGRDACRALGCLKIDWSTVAAGGAVLAGVSWEDSCWECTGCSTDGYNTDTTRITLETPVLIMLNAGSFLAALCRSSFSIATVYTCAAVSADERGTELRRLLDHVEDRIRVYEGAQARMGREAAETLSVHGDALSARRAHEHSARSLWPSVSEPKMKRIPVGTRVTPRA